MSRKSDYFTGAILNQVCNSQAALAIPGGSASGEAKPCTVRPIQCLVLWDI